MDRYSSIKTYLRDLKRHLKGADPALTADALDDAEEHLGEMVSALLSSGECGTRESALSTAVEQYGSPRAIAVEYLRRDESNKKKRSRKRESRESKSLIRRITGVYAEGRTYKNMLYLFLMFPLGILYFVYIITGFSVSMGLLVTFIGIPLLILFLLSFGGIAWFQGRLTEVLLGIRMPRKRRKFRAKGTLWTRLKLSFKNPRLYSSMLYLFLMFPLGIIYFVMTITMISTSIALVLSPIAYLLRESLDLPGGMPGPLWFQLVTMLVGLIMLTWSLHLVNLLARLHGKMSKKLLLRR